MAIDLVLYFIWDMLKKNTVPQKLQQPWVLKDMTQFWIELAAGIKKVPGSTNDPFPARFFLPRLIHLHACLVLITSWSSFFFNSAFFLSPFSSIAIVISLQCLRDIRATSNVILLLILPFFLFLPPKSCKIQWSLSVRVCCNSRSPERKKTCDGIEGTKSWAYILLENRPGLVQFNDSHK